MYYDFSMKPSDGFYITSAFKKILKTTADSSNDTSITNNFSSCPTVTCTYTDSTKLANVKTTISSAIKAEDEILEAVVGTSAALTLPNNYSVIIKAPAPTICKNSSGKLINIHGTDGSTPKCKDENEMVSNYGSLTIYKGSLDVNNNRVIDQFNASELATQRSTKGAYLESFRYLLRYDGKLIPSDKVDEWVKKTP